MYHLFERGPEASSYKVAPLRREPPAQRWVLASIGTWIGLAFLCFAYILVMKFMDTSERLTYLGLYLGLFGVALGFCCAIAVLRSWNGRLWVASALPAIIHLGIGIWVLLSIAGHLIAAAWHAIVPALV